MSTAVQFRGGTTAEHAAFTGAEREITVDTTKDTVVVHDGVTPGGHPLAKAEWLDPQFFHKADYASVVFTKTGAQAIELKANTRIMVAGALLHFTAATAVAMPTLVAGSDYAVFANPDGTLQAVADPYDAPAAAPQSGSRKIGGFHYGLVAPGTTVAGGAFATSGNGMIWTQGAVDDIAGINKYSLWDLCFRSEGEQHGMVLDPQTGVWWAVYFCSTNHIVNGISKYNTDVASGTVLPRIPLAYGGNGTSAYTRLSFYEAQEIAASHGLRLPRYEEFMSAAFGVTENQSLGGAASTIPATARQPGYTSRIGIEQATGHQYAVGGPFTSVAGSAWQSDPGRGSFYGTSGLPLFGGNRNETSNSGSRCSIWRSVPWSSNWAISLRAASDLKISHGIG